MSRPAGLPDSKELFAAVDVYLAGVRSASRQQKIDYVNYRIKEKRAHKAGFATVKDWEADQERQIINYERSERAKAEIADQAKMDAMPKSLLRRIKQLETSVKQMEARIAQLLAR